jgi:hypothetical protein
MSQTDLPTRAMAEQQIKLITTDLEQKKQQIGQMMQTQTAQQALQQNPQAAQQLKPMIEQLIAAAGKSIKKIAEQPTLEQVLAFLRNNRIKSFVLDIETDSTIQATEESEKKRRTEFVGVLAQLLPQLNQMITAEPMTADFCGQLLKFATAPFRAGRPLDGAIDGLIEMLKAKSDQPRPDDPTTSAMKTQLQIEQMKNQTASDKIKADAAIAAAKLQQDMQQHQQKLLNDRAIKQMELDAQNQTDSAKAVVQNQKLMESQQTHQANILGKMADFKLNQQKADLAQQTHEAKLNDMAARQSERAAQQQFKMSQPIGGGPV